MQIKKPKTRGRIRNVVSDLQRVDDRLAELAESLPLPPDVAEMWEGTVPTCFIANLYSAIDAVRSDCIQDAMATLLHAVRRSEESLRHEWCALQEHTPGNSAAGTKETPQC